MDSIKLKRTTHKFTRYELDIVRMALMNLRWHIGNEQDKDTCALLNARLKHEYDDQQEDNK